MVVDTQNVYGSSGDALGQREKPTPEGVVRAFGALGYDVDEVRIAVALPDSQDCRSAAAGLVGQRRSISALSLDLQSLIVPTTVQTALWACTSRLDAARNQCTRPAAIATLGDQLLGLNSLAQRVLAELEPAGTELRAALDGLSQEAKRASGPSPSEWIGAMRALVEATRRIEVIRSAVDSVGSFAYAGEANLAYRRSLPQTAEGAAVKVMEGRFRPGHDGQRPGEKQVDTLCAVACVEATTAAIADGETRSVIVVSDDDDLTPALAHAAGLVGTTDVRVVVAGTSTVFHRHGESPSSPTRPRWITLDASAWCCLVGHDPAHIHAQRNHLALLALGGAGAFTVKDGVPALKSGLKGKLDFRDAGRSGKVALSVVTLSWGRAKDRPIPTMVVGTQGGTVRNVTQVRARRAKGSRIDLRNLPGDAGGKKVDLRVGVPGWWMAGDELIVASVDTRNRKVHRVLGHAPGFQLPGPVAAAKRVGVVAVRGEWAETSDGTDTWGVFVGRHVGLTTGDSVLVCPYERTGRTGPGGQPHHPRAILLSSALQLPDATRDARGRPLEKPALASGRNQRPEIIARNRLLTILLDLTGS